MSGAEVMSDPWLILLVVVPLLAAPVCILLRNGPAAWSVATLVSWAVFGISIKLLMSVLELGEVVYRIGGWDAPWGIEYRLEKLQGNLDRDRQGREEIARLEERYDALDENLREQMVNYRFLIEEYRVSLFAQPVGTSVPVSGKRLEKEWDAAVREAQGAAR